jgi:hypothetical protein
MLLNSRSDHWIVAIRACEKIEIAAKTLLVMDVLDTAIQEKAKHFNVALDGRAGARP